MCHPEERAQRASRRTAVAVALKIPDNAAYTALVALRRLGVAADRVERAEIYLFDGGEDTDALRQRILSDETIFNPNKHRLSLLDKAAPRAGEVWIRSLFPTRGPAAIAWRLSNANGAPVERPVLEMATERLLCNPAIDRAVMPDWKDGDISTAYE